MLGGDGHAPLCCFAVHHIAPQLADFTREGTHILDLAQHGGGHPGRPHAPVDHRGAQPLLDLLDAPGEGGLGDVPQRRSARDRARFGQRDEILEPSQVHGLALTLFMHILHATVGIRHFYAAKRSYRLSRHSILAF